MNFLSVLNRKAIADVTRRKGRTILMILGIFIGVLGLTAVNGANDVFSKDLNKAIRPQAAAGSNFILQGLFDVFLVLAVVALLLTCLMILSTMNNMLAEQFKVIGTMKAIGGTRWKIIRSYLLSVSIYALIGTALGLGLGLALTAQVAGLVAQQAKVDLGPYQISVWVILTSLAAGLLAPILTALLPLWIGTRITVHQAIASYGITTGSNRAWGQRLSGVPQTVWLGLRSVFRKPGRALLTLLALMLSVTVFMAAQITNTSIGVTNAATSFVSTDFQIGLGAKPLLYEQISNSLLNLPNVAFAEPFDHEDVQILDHATRVFGVPDMTHLYRPQLIAGRWLQGHELNTLVISDSAAQRLNAKVGDALTLSQGSRTVRWEVVGIVHELAYASGSADPHGRYGAMFTTLDNLDMTLRQLPVGTANQLYLNAQDHSQAALQRLRGEIQHVLQQAGIAQGQVQFVTSGLNLIVAVYALIDALAIVVALVGLLGLSNTLAAEVLERRREIGILRSLGATGWRVGLVFWIEGATLALIAWLPGILLAIPGGYALVNILSAYIGPIEFSINPIAIVLTLAFILAVSLVASFAPALSASHTRIREILRYE